MKKPSILSTADVRRESVIESALVVFANSGYVSTPVTAVAAKAGISQAYVFRLFPTKEALFVAAVERCYERIETALATSADMAASRNPDEILSKMADGYAELIADRTILMIQVHAQASTDVAAIADAVRQGLARIVRFVKTRSGASDEAVQRFIAFGQLCHLITTTGLNEISEDWAKLLALGIRHVPAV